MSAVVAGATGVDGAAEEFGAGVVGAGDIANDPGAVEERAFFRDDCFFDVDDRFVEMVATKLELVLVAAHENLVRMAVDVYVGARV